MPHHDHEPCCSPSCPDCAFGPFTRNHYFTGKLLVERDFTDEQKYHVDKLRHHNAVLHGHGVVCGLLVTPHENPACRDRFVCIEPGTAIDCCGHEIVVRERDCIDLTALESYREAIDDPERTHRLQVCIRYRECPTEEVPVLYDDCSCDESRCAPNRILESWEVDLLIDRPLPTHTPGTPAITWANTVPVAHPVAVAIHDASQRLYVLTAEGTIFPIRTDNHSLLAPLVPTSPALALAVANDGARLYVAIGPNDREVLVYDTANLSAGPIHTLTIGSSAGSSVELVVAPVTGQLLALIASSGRLLQWKTDINVPGSPAAPDDLTLAPNLRSLTVSSDGARAWAVDPDGHQIRSAKLAPATVEPPIVPPGTLDLFAMAVVRTTAPDALVVVSKADRTLRLFTPGSTTMHSIVLTNEPYAVIVSPDGHAAFVVERDAAKSYVQVVNLFRLGQGTLVTPGTPFEVGRSGERGGLTASGARLYQPYTGDTAVAGDGAVAILELSSARCGDLLSGECPECDEPDCLILATIENYNRGDRFEAQTDPAADPVADTAAKVVRLDNQTGRVLLPSTQALAQALQCVIEHGGSGAPGPQGPPGPAGTNGTNGTNGANGADGLGLNPNLPKIIDIGWTHNGEISLEKWIGFDHYDAHPKETMDRPPFITLYFNEPEMRNIDRQTFQVSIHYPQMLREKLFTGLYNTAKVDLYGYILPLGPRPTPHTGEAAKSAYAFVVYREFFQNVHGLFDQFWQGANYNPSADDLRLDNPAVRVLLKGDFVYAGPDPYQENRVLDADNIGGKVGDGVYLRPGPITGGKNPSGDLAHGGTFESWFFLTRGNNPIGRSPNLERLNRIALLTGDPLSGPDINTATSEELREVAGMTEAAMRRIVRARESEPFRDLDDLQSRARINEEQARAIASFFLIR